MSRTLFPLWPLALAGMVLFGCGDIPLPDDVDADGDGFSSTGGGDCNDDDKTIFPGATEIPYDGIDQDCSGKDLADVDKDGHDATQAGGDDCDDNNPYVKPDGKEVCGDDIDQDCDGYDLSCSTVDKDGDGYAPSQGDCNDDDKTINPGMTETPYNGKDDDCDVQTPDDDLDGDGFSKMGGGDCNDDDKTIFPGATEIPYDGIDQDCSGNDLADVDKDGYDATEAGGDDCDDKDAKINPGAAEIPYDTTDQNCDGSDLLTTGAIEIYVPISAVTVASRTDVASNGSDYLVVWAEWLSESGGTTYSIKGQRVLATGAKVGTEVTFRQIVGSSLSDPAVASDGTDYLAVWRGYDSVLKQNLIQARRFTKAGSLAGGTITLRATANSVYSPLSVAYSSGVYAVVWREYASPTHTINLQLVTSGGALSGGAKQVTNNTSTLYWPEIASDPSSNFLVAWYISATGGYDMYGRILDPFGGYVAGPSVISDAAGSQYYPQAAFDGTNYLVVWRDSRNSNNDVYGQLVSPTCSAVGTSADQNLPVSDALNTQDYPAVKYCSGRYTVVFKDYRYQGGAATLFKQPVGSDGSLKDATSTTNILLYASGSNVYYPRLACGGSKALVVWAESQSGGYKIMGLLTDP